MSESKSSCLLSSLSTESCRRFHCSFILFLPGRLARIHRDLLKVVQGVLAFTEVLGKAAG